MLIEQVFRIFEEDLMYHIWSSEHRLEADRIAFLDDLKTSGNAYTLLDVLDHKLSAVRWRELPVACWIDRVGKPIISRLPCGNEILVKPAVSRTHFVRRQRGLRGG